MPTYSTPGVYIHDVLSDPARVLRTGIPVFLGLITAAELDACNLRLPEGRKFITLSAGRDIVEFSIVRKQGIERLPARFYPPANDLPYSDPSSANRFMILRNGQPTGSGDNDPSRKPQRFTMWLQFKLNPAPMDPIQQQMFSIMPWIMMFMMAPFAAGLQLYWIMSNVLTIAQQKWLYSRHPALKEPVKA